MFQRPLTESTQGAVYARMMVWSIPLPPLPVAEVRSDTA
jgi:hypothetical protein